MSSGLFFVRALGLMPPNVGLAWSFMGPDTYHSTTGEGQTDPYTDNPLAYPDLNHRHRQIEHPRLERLRLTKGERKRKRNHICIGRSVTLFLAVKFFNIVLLRS